MKFKKILLIPMLTLLIAGAFSFVNMNKVEANTDNDYSRICGYFRGGNYFIQDLELGTISLSVKTLQEFLILEGYSISSEETDYSSFQSGGVTYERGYFGPETQTALASWQSANGVSPAVGYFGPITRAVMTSSCTSKLNSQDVVAEKLAKIRYDILEKEYYAGDYISVLFFQSTMSAVNSWTRYTGVLKEKDLNSGESSSRLILMNDETHPGVHFPSGLYKIYSNVSSGTYEFYLRHPGTLERVTDKVSVKIVNLDLPEVVTPVTPEEPEIPIIGVPAFGINLETDRLHLYEDKDDDLVIEYSTLNLPPTSGIIEFSNYDGYKKKVGFRTEGNEHENITLRKDRDSSRGGIKDIIEDMQEDRISSLNFQIILSNGLETEKGLFFFSSGEGSMASDMCDPPFFFTSNMTLGSRGQQVTELQKLLIAKGYFIRTGATGYFDAQTMSALASYQSANGIYPAVGYFGPKTREHITRNTYACYGVEQPETPETPVTPEEPGTPENVDPGYDRPNEPETPETPAEPETPVTPEEPETGDEEEYTCKIYRILKKEWMTVDCNSRMYEIYPSNLKRSTYVETQTTSSTVKEETEEVEQNTTNGTTDSSGSASQGSNTTVQGSVQTPSNQEETPVVNTPPTPPSQEVEEEEVSETKCQIFSVYKRTWYDVDCSSRLYQIYPNYLKKEVSSISLGEFANKNYSYDSSIHSEEIDVDLIITLLILGKMSRN